MTKIELEKLKREVCLEMYETDADISACRHTKLTIEYLNARGYLTAQKGGK